MKEIAYLIFAVFYRIFCLLRIKEKKVCCIMHHDSSRDSNVGMVIQFLSENREGYTFCYITKEEAAAVKGRGIIISFFPFFIGKPYHLATSEFILQDDVFLPFSKLRLRKGTKDIQLWHGTGTIKKFGQDSNTGKIKLLESKANENITHLIVNSKAMAQQYAGAFGIPVQKVYPIGLPRTDVLFWKEKIKNDKTEFFHEYPDLKFKKIVIYAPTFRDSETHNPKIHLDIALFLSMLPKDYVLLLKLHPHVASAFHFTKEDQKKYRGRCYNVSFYSDTNTLLAVSDVLITDYSSIIFEYVLQEKPMIFYAYDLENFSNEGRGFYCPYKEFVPGPVVETTMETAEVLLNWDFDAEKIHKFKQRSFDYLDGGSTKRLVETVFDSFGRISL